MKESALPSKILSREFAKYELNMPPSILQGDATILRNFVDHKGEQWSRTHQQAYTQCDSLGRSIFA